MNKKRLYIVYMAVIVVIVICYFTIKVSEDYSSYNAAYYNNLITINDSEARKCIAEELGAAEYKRLTDACLKELRNRLCGIGAYQYVCADKVDSQQSETIMSVCIQFSPMTPASCDAKRKEEIAAYEATPMWRHHLDDYWRFIHSDESGSFWLAIYILLGGSVAFPLGILLLHLLARLKNWLYEQ